MRMFSLFMCVGLLACDTKTDADAPSTCDGRAISDGQEVALQLEELGYMGGDTGMGLSDEYQRIISDEKSWAELTAFWGSSGGLEPDFSTQAVFVNAWVYGGCGEAFQYSAWQWEDVLRVQALHVVEEAVCDAYFPQVDLLLVSRNDAVDVNWCDAP